MGEGSLLSQGKEEEYGNGKENFIFGYNDMVRYRTDAGAAGACSSGEAKSKGSFFQRCILILDMAHWASISISTDSGHVIYIFCNILVYFVCQYFSLLWF